MTERISISLMSDPTSQDTQEPEVFVQGTPGLRRFILDQRDALRPDRTDIELDGEGAPAVLQFARSLQDLMVGGVLVDLALGEFQLLLKVPHSFKVGGMGGTLSGIDGVFGTRWNDTLIGSTAANTFDPGRGQDVVVGGSGVHGAAWSGKDRVNYSSDFHPRKGIVVKAQVGLMGQGPDQQWVPVARVRDVGGSIDLLLDISYITGSMQADVYVGDPGPLRNAHALASEELQLLPGTHAYLGEFAGMGGADVIRGNQSVIVSYLFDPRGVSVNLGGRAFQSDTGQRVAPGTAHDGFGSVDRLKGVTAIRGSELDDTIVMGKTDDWVSAEGGDDRIVGNRGNDHLRGGAGDDTIEGGIGLDIMFGNTYREDAADLVDRDIFVFRSVRDAAGSAAVTGQAWQDQGSVDLKVGDIIGDFQVGHDKLDLSAIDANPLVRGNQAFALADQLGMPGTLALLDGQLQLNKQAGQQNEHVWAEHLVLTSSPSPVTADGSLTQWEQQGVYLVGDTDGDGQADFSIFLVGVSRDELMNLPVSDWLIA
jgi:Ca2+-binding RTX toxin-like protein